MKMLKSVPNEDKSELLRVERKNWNVTSEDIKDFVEKLYKSIDKIILEAVENGYQGLSNYYLVTVSNSKDRIGFSKGFGVIDKQGLNITQTCLEQHLDILSKEKIYPCKLDFHLSLSGHRYLSTKTLELPSPFLN